MAAVVNLDKMREIADDKKARRQRTIEKAVETKRRKKEIVSIFTRIYKELIGAEYELRKARFRSRRTNGAVERYRIDSDADCIWKLYQRIINQYNGSVDDYKIYIRHAIVKAVGLEFIETIPQFFGFVVSDKVLDDFFFKQRKRAASHRATNENVMEMSSKHARLFDR